MGAIHVISQLTVLLSVLCQIFGMVSSKHFGQFSNDYQYRAVLDPVRQLYLHWSVEYSNDTVLLKVVANSFKLQGFGVGFSPTGEVSDSDFVVLWTSSSGVHHFQDAWTDGQGILHVDRQQDAILVGARTSEDLTILEYMRAVDTCDPQDYQLDNGTTNIVFFFIPEDAGPLDHVSGRNVSSFPHGNQRVQLLKPPLQPPPLPADTWTFTILAPAVKVPDRETTYWWYTTRLPPHLHSKHHIIKYEGVIDGGSENIVHHIEVFHCVGAMDSLPYFNGPGEGEGKPPKLGVCRHVLGAWAMGAGPIVYPEEAGSPVGGANSSPFVLLEVHYNNPTRKTGIVDSSGIRFYVTSSLRPHDAGIMELGLEYTDKMAIPPGQSQFKLTGFCVDACTRVGIPRNGMKIFASQLHTHLTGRKVYTKHVRQGRELPELNRDNHYSPHFQEIRMLPEPVEILPGDALMTTCEFNTADRANVTVGGLAITDEMCVNYIHYYPRNSLEVCKSSIDTQALDSFFNFANRMEERPTTPASSPRENYHALEWTPLNTHLLNYLYTTSPLSMQCNQSDGHRFPGKWDGTPTTKIIFTNTPKKDTCD